MDLKDYEIEYNQMVEKIHSDLESEFKNLDFKSGLYYLTKYNYKYHSSDDVVGCYNDKLWTPNQNHNNDYVIVNGVMMLDRHRRQETIRFDKTIKLIDDMLQDVVKRYIIEFNDNNKQTVLYEGFNDIKYGVEMDDDNTNKSYDIVMWSGIKNMSRELEDLENVLLEPQYFDEWSVSDPRVFAMMKKHNGKIYLIAVADDDEDILNVQINIDSKYSVTSVKALHEDSDGSFNSGDT